MAQREEICYRAEYIMEKLLKWIGPATLVCAFIASSAISQYQIGQLVEHVGDIQDTQTAIVVNQAKVDIRLDYIEKE